MNFRDVSAAIHRAVMREHSFDLGAGRFDLVAENRSSGSLARVTLRFEGVASFKASSGTVNPDKVEIAVTGLERLDAGEPWRLYIKTQTGSELELACRSIFFDGEEVTGIGRSYLT